MRGRLALLIATASFGGVAVMPHAAAAIVCPLASERATTCCGPPTAAVDAMRAVPCCAAAETRPADLLSAERSMRGPADDQLL